MNTDLSDDEVWFAMDRLLAIAAWDCSVNYPYGLNIPSANVFLLCSTHGSLMNGGLEYFFEVEHPGVPAYTVISDIYRDIGAPDTADCILKALEFFRFPDPHLKEYERHAAIRKWDEDHPHSGGLFDDLDTVMFDEDPGGKILRYMRENFDQLPPPDK